MNHTAKSENNKRRFSWKYILIIISVLAVASIAGAIGRQAVKTMMKPSQQEIEKILTEGFTFAATQINQKLPMMLDEDTRLDKATVGPGTRVVYHNTFPKYTSKDIDANWLRTNLKPEVMQKICTSGDMKKSLQLGGIYVYAYSGNDGIEIARFEIDRNDCKLAKISP
jgi:hypothetical protein